MCRDRRESFTEGDVLEQEIVHLHGALPDGCTPASPGTPLTLQTLHGAVHRVGHAALCLSGGGIRSAAFALGVMQGLARRSLLGTFDYLSTVSGGGYAGGWLSAWLYHANQKGHEPDVVFSAIGGRQSTAAEPEPEPEPIGRIREYSNYLDPKLGLFSVDVWTLAATVARNLLLNWLVLIPLLAATLLVPRLYFAATSLGEQFWLGREDLLWWSVWLQRVGVGLLALSMVHIVVDLPSCGNRQRGQAAFLGFCLGPLCAGTVALTMFWAWSRTLDVDSVTLRDMVALGASGHTLVWLLASFIGPRWWRPWMWVGAAASGAAGGAGLWWFAMWLFAKDVDPVLFASVGVPTSLAVIALAGALFVGLASGETSDEDREWWSRFGGWLLVVIVGWLMVSAILFVGPWLLGRLLDWLRAHRASDSLAKTLVAGFTALTGGIAARNGQEHSRTPAEAQANWPRRVAFALAAPAFVVLLFMVLAASNRSLLQWLESFHLVPDDYHLPATGFPETVLLFAILVIGGTLMGWFVAVNKFSLHGMYRDRLIRAFLGASRPAAVRRPNPFTGFDPDDNVMLHELRATRRPLHVVNTTLNLVSGKRLAWQERKAASFVLTPLVAGARALGYRPIAEYAGPQGMSLGTAITISGAAASPSMGARSSPALTFLLTLFNARLGAWLGNPGPAGRFTWRRRDPVIGAGPLLREMFGRTTDQNPYVYLSDGGHFENLGLYEMVARRCRHIVVSDGACDPGYALEDLGNAIRKIRIDFGIPIEFSGGVPMTVEGVGTSNRHGALGVIRYSAVDGPVQDGVLLYLKATLSGDEPVDVRNYAAAHPEFPHESTADQWFGEAQFESYRALGLHTVESLAAGEEGRAALERLSADR